MAQEHLPQVNQEEVMDYLSKVIREVLSLESANFNDEGKLILKRSTKLEFVTKSLENSGKFYNTPTPLPDNISDKYNTMLFEYKPLCYIKTCLEKKEPSLARFISEEWIDSIDRTYGYGKTYVDLEESIKNYLEKLHSIMGTPEYVNLIECNIPEENLSREDVCKTYVNLKKEAIDNAKKDYDSLLISKEEKAKAKALEPTAKKIGDKISLLFGIEKAKIDANGYRITITFMDKTKRENILKDLGIYLPNYEISTGSHNAKRHAFYDNSPQQQKRYELSIPSKGYTEFEKHLDILTEIEAITSMKLKVIGGRVHFCSEEPYQFDKLLKEKFDQTFDQDLPHNKMFGCLSGYILVIRSGCNNLEGLTEVLTEAKKANQSKMQQPQEETKGVINPVTFADRIKEENIKTTEATKLPPF